MDKHKRIFLKPTMAWDLDVDVDRITSKKILNTINLLGLSNVRITIILTVKGGNSNGE